MTIVPISENLVREETWPLAEVKLLEEIDEWCRGHLTGPFRVVWRSTMDRRKFGLRFEANFANDNDAIMFKLRWVG